MLGQFFKLNSEAYRPYGFHQTDNLLHALEHNRFLGEVKKELYLRLERKTLTEKQSDKFVTIVNGGSSERT